MTERQGARRTTTRRTLEHVHHVVNVMAMALLVVLGTAPAYLHHLASLGGIGLLAGVDHIGAFCLTAIHLLLNPVHYAFHTLIACGIAYAVFDRARALRLQRRTLSLLHESEPRAADAFRKAAAAAGMDLRGIRIVPQLPVPAFTSGLFAPRVYLAEELATCLTSEQLTAVIAHEVAHARRRDPLRVFLLRLLACLLFWIPAVRRLTEDLQDEIEVRADDAAIMGSPLVLASAILVLADWQPGRRSLPLPAVVGFHHDLLLDRRVRRLAGEVSPARSHLTRRSIAGALLALALVWSTGMVMTHPLPANGHATGSAGHCEHHGKSAVGHLFCLGSPFSRRAADDCPHLAIR